MTSFKEFTEQKVSQDARKLGAKGIIESFARDLKVGEYADFYAPPDGEKLYGEVLKNDGINIKFKVKGQKNVTLKIQGSR